MRKHLKKAYSYSVCGRFVVHGAVIANDNSDAKDIILADLKENLTDFEISEFEIIENKNKKEKK